jgi:hypothetical protein
MIDANRNGGSISTEKLPVVSCQYSVFGQGGTVERESGAAVGKCAPIAGVPLRGAKLILSAPRMRLKSREMQS